MILRVAISEEDTEFKRNSYMINYSVYPKGQALRKRRGVIHVQAQSR